MLVHLATTSTTYNWNLEVEVIYMFSVHRAKYNVCGCLLFFSYANYVHKVLRKLL